MIKLLANAAWAKHGMAIKPSSLFLVLDAEGRLLLRQIHVVHDGDKPLVANAELILPTG